MNTLQFVQTGGWPLKLDRLQEMQDAWLTLQSFGSLAGNLTIIKGCELVGDTIKPGFLYINGELIEFKESYLVPDAAVVIIEEENPKEFENGEIKNVYTERYATFGASDDAILWSQFKRPIELKTIPSDFIARFELLEKKAAVFGAGGGMVLWKKPANLIPEGWAEVVDWRGRLPIGYNPADEDFDAVGKFGGSKTHTNTIAEMAPHKHKLNLNASDSGNTERRVQGGSLDTPGWSDVDVEAVGGGQPYSIMNPYKVVMFIEFVG